MKFLASFMVMVFVILAIPSSYADNQSKVLVVLTSHSELGNTGEKTGFWLPELTHPYYKFKEAGYIVDVASVQGGTAPIDHKIFDLPDEQESNERFLQDAKLMAKVFRTIPLSKVIPSDYVAVVYAGGSGTMWDFPNNKYVLSVTASIYDNNGIVSAICHGPAALVNVKLSNGKYLISGKRVSAITNEEEEDLKMTKVNPFMLQNKLTERGAKHVYGKPWQENVVVDGRLITGQNPASASKVAEKIIEYLKHNRK